MNVILVLRFVQLKLHTFLVAIHTNFKVVMKEKASWKSKYLTFT